MARVVEEVLDGDGDSMEGPHRMGSPRGSFPGLGGKPRLPFEDTDEGMQFSVQRPDAREIEIHQLAGRGLTRRESRRQGFTAPGKGSPAAASFIALVSL